MLWWAPTERPLTCEKAFDSRAMTLHNPLPSDCRGLNLATAPYRVGADETALIVPLDTYALCVALLLK